MTENDQQIQLSRWSFIGGPEGGSVAAISIYKDTLYKVFAATGIGILTSSGDLDTVGQSWERMVNSPGNVFTLETSPNYRQDHFIIAGNHSGIFYSSDEGQTWQPGILPRQACAVTSIALSPNFVQDGIIFAGTQEDGVIYSSDRGQNWETRNFGFLNPSVYVLALSPSFTEDNTAYAGTEDGLYYTYNGGLAWRELKFPENVGTILSIALSPDFVTDKTIFIGTEEGGLFVSHDKGKTWHLIQTPGIMINTIHISRHFEQDHALMSVTDKGIFRSVDAGESWHEISKAGDGVCLARTGDLSLVGLVGGGLLKARGEEDLQPVTGIYARMLTCLKLSPAFEGDGVAFACGIGEGLWRTRDGGKTWETLSSQLPEMYVIDFIFSPNYKVDHSAFVATESGVYLTHDSGDSWQNCQPGSVNHLAISPTGNTILAGTPGNGVIYSTNGGEIWGEFNGPWKANGLIKDIAIASDANYFIAYVNLETKNIEFSIFKSGRWYRIITGASNEDYIRMEIPESYARDSIWYVITGTRVWRMGVREDIKVTGYPVRGQSVDPNDSKVLSLTCVQGKESRILLASAADSVYRSADGLDWVKAFKGQQEPMLCLVPSPSYQKNKRIYALGLGGRLWKALIR